MANYYEIMGINKNATQDEIKAAYRKLAKQYHPDLHPGDAAAAEKMKEINAANDVLSDPEKRKQYDFELEHPGMSGAGGNGFDFNGFQGGFSGFGDIFGDFFSSFTGGGQARQEANRKGQDITQEVELSFLDAAKGCKRDITYTRKEPCKACKGTGAKDGKQYTTCTKCKGSGQVQYVQNGGFFQTVRVGVCPDCGGSGKNIKEKCPDCQGKGYNRTKTTVTFDIPAGADTNSYMRKKGYGDSSSLGGEPGDLIVVFKVAPHKLFKRKDFNIYLEVPITFTQAALGDKIKVPTLDNMTELPIPEGTQSGKSFVLRGKGIKGRNGTGDMYVTVIVEVPTRLTKVEKDMLLKFNDDIDIKQYDKLKKYDDNCNSLYGESVYKK